MNEQIKSLSPADLAETLSEIKVIGKEKGWIRDTQIKHIDLILGQLYRAQAKIVKDGSNGN